MLPQRRSTFRAGARPAALCAPAALALFVILSAGTVAQVQSPPANAAGTPQRLHLVSTPWSPFTGKPGTARFATELVDEALKRINVGADTTIVDEGALTAALANRRFDGSAALWHDEERAKTLLFSEPYLENRLMLVARKGSDVSATTVEALRGKRIALVEGYSYGDTVKRSGMVIVNAPTSEGSLQMVLDNKADYALIDELMVDYISERYPEEVRTRLAVGTTPLVVRPLHFALRREVPNAQAIIDNFNRALPKMVADHSYHRLLRIPWIEADIDGDGRKEYVPASEQAAGTAAPSHGYRLFTEPGGEKAPSTNSRRIYVGGSIYEDWMAVPDQYKVTIAGAPAPMGGSTASLFTIRW